MKFVSLRGSAIAVLLLCAGVAEADPAASPADIAAPTRPAAADAKPDVATLLFGTPQWEKAPVGAKLRYGYEKTTTGADLGTPFKDEVVLTLAPGEDAKSRTTEVQFFSGANRKPAGPFRSDQQNPVLLLILENNVQELSTLFKANPRYLKNAIRKAWREDAKIEPSTDVVDGKPMAVTRITVTPFVKDLESDRMKGLQTLSYTVDVSDDVPGYIAAIDIRTGSQGKTLFAETLRYSSEIKP